MYFDNGCRVCRAGAFVAAKAGLAGQENLNPLQDMDELTACSINQEIYCNEMAVYDPTAKETRYGVRGIVWMLEDRFGKIVRVFLFPPLLFVLEFFYHIFSYNRRLIAPVYTAIENDCKPEFHWVFRISYLVVVSLFSAALSYLVGLSLSQFFSSGAHYLAMVGCGWLLHSLFIFVYGVRNKMDYYCHLATIMMAGILVQVPFVFAFYFFGSSSAWICVSLVLSDLLMSYLSYRRVRFLGLSQALTFAWWITLHLSAAVIFLLCR